VPASSEEKSDESKGSFYEELEQVFDHFPLSQKVKLQFWNKNIARTQIRKVRIYGTARMHFLAKNSITEIAM